MTRWAYLLGLGAFIACAPPSIDGPSRGVDRLPDRSNDDAVGKPAPDAGSAIVTAPAIATTTADAAPPASKACAGISSALCFSFEGDTKSSSSLQPSVVSGINFVPGRENQAASFTAGSEFQFAPSAVFELPADGATIEAWIKREDTGADAVIFDDDGRFSLTISALGAVLCKSSGGAVLGRTAVAVGAWEHVACVVDAGTIHAYLDGVEDGNAPGAIGSAPTLAASLGANSPPGSAEGDQHFVGIIDSFRLIAAARTPDQIKSDATAP